MKLISSLLLVLLLSFINSFSQIEPIDTDFNGSRNISTLDHLRWISENDSSWSWNFELDNDIDASDTKNWNVGDHDGNPETPDSATGFIPIGGVNADSTLIGFTGKFNGNGHKISNLFSQNPVFGVITKDALIENLKIIMAEIKYKYSLSAFCEKNSGQIVNCHIFCYNSTNYGLFCGINNGIITKSVSKGAIYGVTSLGGFCGLNHGKISFCYSDVQVISAYLRIGGFCGTNSGTITQCFSTGNVLAEVGEVVGGFCGINWGIISDCYTFGNVNAKAEVGGFLGWNDSIVTNCYSIGKPNSNYTNKLGGFCYVCDGEFNNCYWDVETSQCYVDYGALGKTTAEMKTQSTFVDWDFENIWAINPNINNGYPYLRGTPIVSVEDKKINIENNFISIYPNPAEDILYIESQTDAKLIRKVEIFNMLGVRISSFDNIDFTSSIRINLATMQNGNYFVKINKDDEIITKKIIVYR